MFEIIPFITMILLLFGISILGWLVSIALKDASIVDVLWPLFSVYYVLVGYYIIQPTNPFVLLFLGLIIIWGVRLGLYLGWRNLISEKQEDQRYRHIRNAIGLGFWWKSLYLIFWLQVLLSTVIALPIFGVLFTIPPLYNLPELLVIVLQVLALGTMTKGIIWETVADYQLAKFKAKPENQGKVMNHGVWSYHRHPNYFGEWLVWLGINLFAIASGHLWCIVSAILISWLLMNFSGVKRLERYVGKREGYAQYIETTPAFFPKLIKIIQKK